jgi:molecular chaperone DnaK (HSP70)
VPTKVLAPVLLAAREVKHQLCEHESAHVELNLGTHRVVSDVTRSSVAHVAVHDLLALVDVVRQHLEAQPDALVVLAGGGSRLPLLGPLFDSAGIASVHADADLLSAAHVRSR